MKSFKIVLALCLLMFGIVGCGSNDTPAAKKSGDEKAAKADAKIDVPVLAKADAPDVQPEPEVAAPPSSGDSALTGPHQTDASQDANRHLQVADRASPNYDGIQLSENTWVDTRQSQLQEEEVTADANDIVED